MENSGFFFGRRAGDRKRLSKDWLLIVLAKFVFLAAMMVEQGVCLQLLHIFVEGFAIKVGK